jgi:RimJ/RimL family protein N-acetyltransferase
VFLLLRRPAFRPIPYRDERSRDAARPSGPYSTNQVTLPELPPDENLYLTTERLVLEPLSLEHADEMVVVLGDRRLHEFTGGEPLPLASLRQRFQFLSSRRSPDGSELWLNWAIRVRDEGVAVGYVQASVSADRTSDVAWVLGLPWWGRGYATEAARRMAMWLQQELGVGEFVAWVHPAHVASQKVAQNIGLRRTDELKDGEQAWRKSTG